jgi:uncharacterized protein (TIGR02466 family)
VEDLLNKKINNVMEFKVYEQEWFTTPVWECPVSGIDNKSIKNYCLQVKKEKPGVIVSNRGGWHSKELITPLPQDLEILFNDLTIFVNDVCARYTGINNLKLGNFWININGHHDYNIAHDHQNSILSGVYYISVPKNNMGDLVLHRGDNAEFFLTNSVERVPTMANALSVNKPAQESTFYLFPSWIKHHVERNESNDDRISIAFNFVPEDK